MSDLYSSISKQLLLDSEASETTFAESFMHLFTECLSAAGIDDDVYISYFRSDLGEISGMSFDEISGELCAYTTWAESTSSLVAVKKSSIEQKIRDAEKYLRNLFSGKIKDVDSALEVSDLNKNIKSLWTKKKIKKMSIRVGILGKFNGNFDSVFQIDNKQIRIDIWDFDKLIHYLEENAPGESISIDFDPAIPILSTSGNRDIRVLVGVINGDQLANAYNEFGSRLLELNVRSFLEIKGAVNKGIRETLLSQPELFMAYNNGITATAVHADFTQNSANLIGVRSLKNLQIVNGGQTTATISHVKFVDETSVSDVEVPIKIVLVADELRDKYVPLISRFSNTQNKVTTVDFSSNHEFHKSIESYSRDIWVPNEVSAEISHKWFYERMRGQYVFEFGKASTPVEINRFKLEFPNKCKFNKAEVAKWLNAWNQLPHVVSLGQEKNFKYFMNDLGNRNWMKRDEDFKNLVAQGILFREAEKIVTELKFGGYRANIVAYTISKLSHATSMRIDFNLIWETQGIDKVLVSEMTKISKSVFKILTSPEGTKNVTEWAKKEKCWEKIKELPWTVDKKLISKLLESAQVEERLREIQSSVLSEEEQLELDYVKSFPSGVWFGLSKWAVETNNLLPWQRSLAVGIGRLLSADKTPSVKQNKQAKLAMEKAILKGFKTN